MPRSLKATPGVPASFENGSVEPLTTASDSGSEASPLLTDISASCKDPPPPDDPLPEDPLPDDPEPPPSRPPTSPPSPPSRPPPPEPELPLPEPLPELPPLELPPVPPDPERRRPVASLYARGMLL